MRSFKTSPGLLLFLPVTFGLFLTYTLGSPGQAHDGAAAGTDTAVTVLTGLPSQADASTMGWGWILLGVAVLCFLAALAFAVLAILFFRRCHRGPRIGPDGQISGWPDRATAGLSLIDLSVLLN